MNTQRCCPLGSEKGLLWRRGHLYSYAVRGKFVNERKSVNHGFLEGFPIDKDFCLAIAVIFFRVKSFHPGGKLSQQVSLVGIEPEPTKEISCEKGHFFPFHLGGTPLLIRGHHTEVEQPQSPYLPGPLPHPLCQSSLFIIFTLNIWKNEEVQITRWFHSFIHQYTKYIIIYINIQDQFDVNILVRNQYGMN